MILALILRTYVLVGKSANNQKMVINALGGKGHEK